MEKFITWSSGVIPLKLDNVDTDMIIPAEHLTKISRDGYKDGLFSNLKKIDANFVFNNPQYNKHSILVSKHNFGCGSSREHAVWALQEHGIKVVICCSFSDIFYNNATKNGLLLIKLNESIVEEMLNSALSNSQYKLTVCLDTQTITTESKHFDFQYDKFRRHCLINGLNDLDYLLSKQKEISAYEKTHRSFSR